MGVGAFDSRFGLETYPKDSRGGLTRSIQALVRPVNDKTKIFTNRRTAAIKKNLNTIAGSVDIHESMVNGAKVMNQIGVAGRVPPEVRVIAAL